jgi:hypothetical protein
VKPDVIPSQLMFNVAGVETRPHERSDRVPSYAVWVQQCMSWVPVHDALANGLIPYPTPLPSSIKLSEDSDREASDRRADEMCRASQRTRNHQTP